MSQLAQGIIESEYDRLARMITEQGWTALEFSDVYGMFEQGGVCLRWELHTEFSSYTLFEPVSAQLPLDFSFDDWCEAIPGQLIVSLRIDHHAAADMSPEQAIADQAPRGQQIVVSSIVDGRATLISDFQPRAGDTRFVLIDAGMTQRQAGRTVQRIWEIETYRLLALLGLPLAKAMGQWLRTSEEQLAGLMDGMGAARNASDEQRLLDQLSKLAADVEHSVARTAFRFGASRAYFAIVMQRIDELRERRVTGFPPLREFMERRLLPPMTTCNAMASRQDELSGRIARNSQLLRTRVDIALEQQNQELLAQMNQRARQQLHLQETVEGLSIVAITYYGSQLVHYLTEGLHLAGVAVVPELATALAIPVISATVWWGMRRFRGAHALR